jgi:synaptobrevin family protein YKT6
MKVYCLAVLTQEAKTSLKAVEHDLSTFSYFQRASVQEGMNFFLATVVERTPKGQRQTVQQNSTKKE